MEHSDNPPFLRDDNPDLSRGPDPDWDGGELDLEAERPWSTPKREVRSGTWMRVGFGAVLILAVAEIGVLASAVAVAEPNRDTDDTRVALEAEAATAAEGTGARGLEATQPARIGALPHLESGLTLAAGVMPTRVNRAPPPPAFGAPESEAPLPPAPAPATQSKLAREAASARPIPQSPATPKPAPVEAPKPEAPAPVVAPVEAKPALVVAERPMPPAPSPEAQASAEPPAAPEPLAAASGLPDVQPWDQTDTEVDAERPPTYDELPE